jgi:hypothetical protein
MCTTPFDHGTCKFVNSLIPVGLVRQISVQLQCSDSNTLDRFLRALSTIRQQQPAAPSSTQIQHVSYSCLRIIAAEPALNRLGPAAAASVNRLVVLSCYESQGVLSAFLDQNKG